MCQIAVYQPWFKSLIFVLNRQAYLFVINPQVLGLHRADAGSHHFEKELHGRQENAVRRDLLVETRSSVDQVMRLLDILVEQIVRGWSYDGAQL
jgi:hypothetical protein